MAPSVEQINAFLANPQETIETEIKRWLDPKSDEGKAKIAKGCMALWNSGGGLFVVGFDDKTLLPDRANAPADVRSVFHVDIVQAIIGEFSSQPFPVNVLFGVRDGQDYPVISIPSGVRTPVAAKRRLAINEKELIKDHAVYVRSLSSNNTVSSSEPKRGDWERVVATWMNNREADIGSFVRRHLTGLDLSHLTSIFGISAQPATPTALERSHTLLSRCNTQFNRVVNERAIQLPRLGIREAAIVIDGVVPENIPNAEFLQRLAVTKPRHSGWSPFVISNSPDFGQYFFEDGWECLIAAPTNALLPNVNFWRIGARGEFYHLDGFHEDLSTRFGIKTGTLFDFPYHITRTVEFVSAAQSFARTMGCDDSTTSLSCCFRWTGLKGRTLANLSQPSHYFFHRVGGQNISQDQVVTSVCLPLEVSVSALAPYIKRAVDGLFLVFGGVEIPLDYLDKLVQLTVNTRH